MAQASDGLSPLQLSGQLNSLPCSLTFRQEETISIIRLIEQVGAGAGGGGRDGGAAWGGEEGHQIHLGSQGLISLQGRLSPAVSFASTLS